ncbi:hypothetical protein UFOVP71_359 [uncultured Caudovirales phage]|uniref:Uncharacterized protein n=1 Tax=uncultured Caudovirales phage TaxID=2100421 RepID=A0A6J5TB19_9CAUD|nr:hypothetical protein UFOVP71_359 [uncultured Caudovirales phage]
MYIELSFLFLMYAFSTVALFTSIYAVWTLHEVLAMLRKPVIRKQTTSNKSSAQQKKSTAKGHWD